MKLSLIAAAALASLAVACGTNDDGNVPRLPSSPDSVPTEEPTPAPPPRQLVEGRQLATSPVNLLTDPGFGLTGQQVGFGSFLAFYDGSYEQFELATTLDSRSPAAFGGSVALIKPAGATDKKSDPVLLLTSFLGGDGPFHAQAWVSKSDVKGNPVDLPTDGSAVKVSVADGDPDTGETYDLKPVEGSARTIGGRTWVLLRADIAKPLAHGGFFIVRTGSKGGQVHVAAPEVTSEQLVVGQAVMARGTPLAVAGRPKTASERVAIRKYRALPPRLTPASPKPTPAL